MSGTAIWISQDILDVLEKLRRNQYMSSVGALVRLILRRNLAERGLLSMDRARAPSGKEEKGGRVV